MADFVAGLLYDGQREPDRWWTAAFRATTGDVTVGEITAPRAGRCRMVVRAAGGGPILFRAPDRNVDRGDVVIERFRL